MKVYIITDKDIERLLAEIDRDPQHGVYGGSSTTLTPEQQESFKSSHAFYNYLVRRWLDSIMQSD